MNENLQARVNATFRKLSLLSEGRTVKWNRTSSGKPGSRIPAGVHDNNEPPDPERDPLVVWFEWKLEQANGDERLVLAATVEAELRHARQTHRSPQTMRAGALSLGAVEDSDERDRRIAEDYSGLSALEVCIVESHLAGWVSEKHVKQVRLHGVYDPVTRERRYGGRNPDTGHELPREALLRGEERREWALDQLERGLHVKMVARRLGVEPKQVRRWRDRALREAA